MLRHRIQPRPDYIARVEAQGLSFHARDRYWTEEVCYQLSADDVDALEAATAELHRLYCEAFERVVAQDRLAELAIPKAYHAAVGHSWRDRSASLYGRFDLAFDGQSPPKLLEYNADTPTSLLEAAVIQWTWKQDVYPIADQFNSIHERLIAAWALLPERGRIVVACLADQEEDWVTSAYLLDTLMQAGRAAAIVELSQLGWDPQRRVFVDEKSRPVEQIFKLYPWEWMMREEFGPHLLECRTSFTEPMYKAAFSSKGMLAMLWEFFPGHPNLLETYRDAGHLKSFARKPLLSREGQNIQLVQDGAVIEESGGKYGEEGYIYQALSPLPAFDGAHPVFGSWLVAGEPAGIGIRESSGLITDNESRFVPHWFL
jgi:glutathionylspermidine synthase